MELIRLANAYLDTIVIVMLHPLTPAQMNTLKQLCDSILMRRWPDPRVMRRLYREKKYAAVAALRKRGFNTEIVIQRPTPECLNELEACLSGDQHLVAAVHLALNHTFDTRAEADWFNEWEFAHLTKENGESSFSTGANNTKKKSKGCAPAFYLQFGRDPLTVQVCLYSDKPCPVTGRQCSHLEFRLPSTKRVKAAGIRTIRDLITFDYRKFFRRRFRLRKLNFAAIGRMYRGRKMSRRRDVGRWGVDLDVRAGRTWCFLAKHRVAERLVEVMSEKNSTHDGSDEGVVGSKRYSKFLAEFQFLPVQGILNVLADQPWFDRRYAVKVIDNTPFLPGNAYVTTATAPTRPKPQAGVATHHQFNSKKEVRSVWTPVGVI